jgi:hypothetical protein
MGIFRKIRKTKLLHTLFDDNLYISLAHEMQKEQ